MPTEKFLPLILACLASCSGGRETITIMPVHSASLIGRTSVAIDAALPAIATTCAVDTDPRTCTDVLGEYVPQMGASPGLRLVPVPRLSPQEEEAARNAREAQTGTGISWECNGSGVCIGSTPTTQERLQEAAEHNRRMDAMLSRIQEQNQRNIEIIKEINSTLARRAGKVHR